MTRLTYSMVMEPFERHGTWQCSVRGAALTREYGRVARRRSLDRRSKTRGDMEGMVVNTERRFHGRVLPGLALWRLGGSPGLPLCLIGTQCGVVIPRIRAPYGTAPLGPGGERRTGCGARNVHACCSLLSTTCCPRPAPFSLPASLLSVAQLGHGQGTMRPVRAERPARRPY